MKTFGFRLMLTLAVGCCFLPIQSGRGDLALPGCLVSCRGRGWISTASLCSQRQNSDLTLVCLRIQESLAEPTVGGAIKKSGPFENFPGFKPQNRSLEIMSGNINMLMDSVVDKGMAGQN
ncbi:UNVERIFIED_CONTAM: hypothetical protein K2H54_024564 [Gekko kuhli]